MLDLVAEHAPYRAELVAAFERVLDSGRFVQGPEVESFEQEIGKWIGVPHAIGVSNGSDALLLALQAVGVGPGDEVICPTFTFFATAGAVASLGGVSTQILSWPRLLANVLSIFKIFDLLMEGVTKLKS